MPTLGSDSTLLQQTNLILGDLVENGSSIIIILFSSIGAFIGLLFGIKKENGNFESLKVEINLKKKFSYAIRDFLISILLFTIVAISFPTAIIYSIGCVEETCGLGVFIMFISIFFIGLIVSTIFAIIGFFLAAKNSIIELKNGIMMNLIHETDEFVWSR